GDGAVTATPEAPAPAPKTEAPKVEAAASPGGEPPRPSPQGESAGPSPQGEPLRPSPPRGEGKGEGRGESHRYSPGVQMAASDLKVDLSKVAGTGLGGRVTKKDVQDFAAQTKAAPSAPSPGPATAARPAEGDQVVQLTRVRRLIAENMTRAKQTIPHAWQTQE